MILLSLFLGIALPWLSGLGFLTLMPSGFGHNPRGWPWAVLCALPLGIAMHVLLASLLLILSPGWMSASQVFLPEAALTAVMVIVAIRKLKQPGALDHRPLPMLLPDTRSGYIKSGIVLVPEGTSGVTHIGISSGYIKTGIAVLMTLAFFAGLWTIGAYLLSQAKIFPEGYYDAWHMWNYKARIIAQGQENWRWFLYVPAGEVGHQEYPLGFSVLLARLFLANGRFDPILTSAVGVGAGILAPLMVWAAATRAKGFILGACAGLLVLAFPFSIIQAAWQYADSPLAVLFLATVAWHYFYCRNDRPFTPASRAAWIGYGLLLGSMLWTKNEGLVMAGALVFLTFLADCTRALGIDKSFAYRLSQGLPTLIKHTAQPLASPIASAQSLPGVIKASIRQCQAWGVGSRYFWLAIPFLTLCALHLYVKLSAPEATDLIKDQALDKQFHGLLQLDRVKIIIDFTLDSIFSLIDRYALIAAAAGLLLLGLDRRKSRMWPPAIYTLTLILVSLAYGATFLFTPYDLKWHLSTALSRLMLQLWPVLVFTFILWTYPIERVRFGAKAKA
jgi:hypothetical protein